MKHLFLALSLNLFVSSVHAMTPLNMKPGKWRLETTMSQDGRPGEVNPMDKMREAMKKMSPEQKKQMEAMLAQMNSQQKGQGTDPKAPKIGFDEQGMTVCYTKDMLSSGLDLRQKQESQKCSVSDHQQNAKMVSMKFKCQNGSSGHMQWNVEDQSHMNGSTTVIDKNGKKTEIKHKAEFLSASCD